VPGGFRRLGRLEIDMRVSKSAVQKRTFPDGTASGLDADLKHRAPLGPLAKGDTEPCRVGTWSFSARRWDWSPGQH
jgi:hypothetical protein